MINKAKLATIAIALGSLGIGVTGREVIEFFESRPKFIDPKSAPREDREQIQELLKDGYTTAEAAVSGAQPNDPSYYDRVRKLLMNSTARSSWMKMRLINELGKSDRLEDAGFLLGMSNELEPGWLANHAAQTANVIGRKWRRERGRAGCTQPTRPFPTELSREAVR